MVSVKQYAVETYYTTRCANSGSALQHSPALLVVVVVELVGVVGD